MQGAESHCRYLRGQHNEHVTTNSVLANITCNVEVFLDTPNIWDTESLVCSYFSSYPSSV